MSQKITYEEFVKRLSERTDTIVITSDFLGMSKPLSCKCIVCGYEWVTTEARSILKHGCKKCMDRIRCKKAGVTRRKGEEQFRKDLQKMQPNLIPNDTYISGKTKYHCICKIHNCDVYKTPYKMLYRNQGCNLCAIDRNKCATRYAHETFCEKVKKNNTNIRVLSQYTNIKARVETECLVCGHKWNPIAEQLLRETKYICPKCAKNAIKTPKQFREEISISHPHLTLLTDYERSAKKIHVLCNKCGCDFWTTPNKLQQGQNCSCITESHGENHIRAFLDINDIVYESQKRFDDLVGVSGYRKLSYDFYIPSKNLLIEYQGLQHDKPYDFGAKLDENSIQSRFERQQEHDKRKREYAKEHNIDLLEIWYYDFKNIEKILQEKLLSKAS